MATLSQEINTLKEEIGYQHAILASLQGSTDPNHRYNQAKCLQEIELLQARLLQILRMHMSPANANRNTNDEGRSLLTRKSKHEQILTSPSHRSRGRDPELVGSQDAFLSHRCQKQPKY